MLAYRRLFLAIVLLLILITTPGFSQQRDDTVNSRASAEWYQGKPIRDITFAGLKNVKLSDLEGLMRPFKGRIFDDDVFWEIQKILYETEYFEQISPSAVQYETIFGTEVIIRFAVVESPIVSRINFIGNSGLRRAELLDLITIKINDVINVMKIRLDEQAIITKYLEKGYPDIKVRSDTQPSGDSSIALNFYITEGEKVIIKEFVFQGNSVFSDRTLKSQLSLKAKTLLSDGAFQESKLLADRLAIVRYYHDRGYIDADVIDITRNIQKDEKGNNNLTITFRIHEGRIYTFGGITFEGNRIFSTGDLSKLITSKTGDTVNERRVEADLQKVADQYFENGYIFNTINREEKKDAVTGIVSYNISIVERGRAHIENIIIRGNEKTRTDVILREIPLEPGDVFSKSKVMDGLRNLYNLQYFSMVIPDTVPGSADSLMDLIINVEEQPTTDLQLGLTFSGSSDPDTFPVSALVKWNDRNFRGSGNQLGLDINASPDTVSSALNYTHRWIFGLPLSGGFDFTAQWNKRKAPMKNLPPYFNGDEDYAFPDGFNSFAEYNSSTRVPPQEYLMTYNQWYLSLGFSTGYRWPTMLGNVTLSGGVRVGFIRNVYDATLYNPFDPVLREENNQWTPRNSFWSSLSLDQRDIYYDPSKGYYIQDRFGIYGIFDSERERYLRNDIKAEYFLTLFNIPITETWSFKAVFGIHTGLSLIFRQPGVEKKSFIENANKLSVDGMFVGRGWADEYSNKGLLLWENWAEIRIPLVPGVLAWDFFFDAATIETYEGNYFSGYSFDNMRFSFGGGFRFTIPQFPFRFSLAKRFYMEDGMVKWVEQGNAGALDFVISFALATY
jgi:outer membrane protein insertion porin family